MKPIKILAPIVVAGLALAGCSTSGTSADAGTGPNSTANPSGSLTIWAYGAIDSTPHLQPLVDGFKKKYPNVKVTLQPQPSENYYAMLKAAIVSKTGPDIFTMFPGGYESQFAKYSLDLTNLVPKDTLDAVGASYYSAAGTTTSQVYGVPVTKGLYMMLYNKDLLNSVGVTSVPTTWNEMFAACAKIKVAGKTCVGYGSDQGSSQFFAAPDFSYMFSADPLSDWDKLIAGTKPYDSPELLQQMTKYVSLQTQGYTNKDVMTWKGYRDAFLKGDVAFYMTGSWDGTWAQNGLGDKVAAAPAPWSDAPINTLVQLPDTGWSVNKDTKNQTAALAFMNYTISQEGQEIVSQAGSVPSLPGVPLQNRVNNDLITQAQSSKWKIVPMFDNFVATAVNTALGNAFNQALAGQISPEAALKQVDAATAKVPQDQRISYNLGASQS